MRRVLLLVAASAALISTSVLAADLPNKPAVAPPPVDWSGFYAGFNLGYGPGSALSTDDDFDYDSSGNSGEIDFSGWFFGGQAGYDFDLKNGLVVGVAADIEATWEAGGVPMNDTTAFAYDTLHWTGAVTGRAGYAVSDSLLAYLLAGAAFANNTIDNGYGTSYGGSTTNTHIGYTAGIGLEARLTQNLSGFVEARYADYGLKEYGAEDSTGTAEAGPVALSDASIRTGMNFHF